MILLTELRKAAAGVDGMGISGLYRDGECNALRMNSDCTVIPTAIDTKVTMEFNAAYPSPSGNKSLGLIKCGGVAAIAIREQANKTAVTTLTRKQQHSDIA